MDALSDVLHAVRLIGAAYLTAEFTAPWCVVGRTDGRLCPAYLPPSNRVISYHLITEGSCWVKLDAVADSAIEVFAGEIIVIPQGETHQLCSDFGFPKADLGPLTAEHLESAPGNVLRLSHGGGGAATRMVCGFLACDEVLSNPLLASLPRLFKVDVRHGSGSAWLESSLRFAAEEAAVSKAGGAMMLARLSELLFVEAMRRCIETLPEGEKNWLAGLRDRFVGRALTLMHGKPAYPWTVDELAREVGLSRSALAQRFSEFLALPPMQYLARWRLQMAARQLRDSTDSLADVSERAGYESEAAFSRAFKREFGKPPASWRRDNVRQRTVNPGPML